MNQPSLKKVHSVDYASGHRSAPAPPPRNNKPLLHSVSIVVELAKESPNQSSRTSAEHENTSKDVTQIPMTTDDLSVAERRLIAPPEPKSIDSDSCNEVEDDADNDEGHVEGDEEEEEEEEEEELDDLTSGLARRVVIVDEADKILLARAQSAEPRLFGSDTPAVSVAPETTRPSTLMSATSSDLVNRQTLIKRQSLAGGGGATCSGELAERGALRLLGMRRNTHHHVNVPTMAYARPLPAINHPASGASVRASAQLEAFQAPPVGGNGGGGGENSPPPAARCSRQAVKYHHQPSSPISLRNWSQRRQSLQISLLSGSDICSSSGSSSSISKSLTEEELRGEREFNEQVRQAKSPDIFTPASIASTRHQLSARCQSAAAAAAASSKLSPGDKVRGVFGSKLIESSSPPVLQAQNQQQQLKTRSPAQRRVSFGSIDPLLKQRESNARASFACYPISHLSLLEYNQQDNNNNKESCSKVSKIEEEEQRKSCIILNKQKRHSLAVSNYNQLGALNYSAPRQQQQRKTSVSNSTTHNSKSNSNKLLLLDSNHPSSCDSANRSDEDLLGNFSSGGSCSSEANTSSNDACEQTKLMTTTALTNTIINNSKNTSQLGFSSALKENMNDNSDALKDCISKSERPAETLMESKQEKLGSSADSRVTSSTTSAITFETQVAPNNQVQVMEGNRIQSIMANARLRQEEFARLLEEHEQIVNEINRVETKISSSQTNLQHQQQENK